MNVSAVLVTRGDVDMTPILESLPFDDIVVWNNLERRDMSVFGRYCGIDEARHDIIYVQDDDCIVPVDPLLGLYVEGERLCSMSRHRWPDYPNSSLVGWGALFPRDDPECAFGRYLYPQNTPVFRRCCDVIFTTLMPFRRVDVGHTDLAWAAAADRMYHQPSHYSEREMVRRQAMESLEVAA